MRNKLVKTLDIVLSARLVHADVEQIKERTHKVCDPHLALSTLGSARPTINNPVDVAVELAMVDAAAALAKDCLDEIEKLQRAVAKTIMQIEVLEALGATVIPPEDIEQLEEQFQQCGLRLQELEATRQLTETRSNALVGQL